MAAEYGGFIQVVDDPKRASLLQGKIGGGASFTEAVSEADWEPKRAEMILLSLDGKALAAASLARRIGSAARGKAKIRLSDHVELKNAGFVEIEKALGQRLAAYFGTAAKGGGHRVPCGPAPSL